MPSLRPRLGTNFECGYYTVITLFVNTPNSLHCDTTFCTQQPVCGSCRVCCLCMHRHRAYAIFVSPQLFEGICQLSVDPPSPPRPLTNMSCDQCDAIYNYVQLLVVKGNLRHRIEKLGTEKDEAELNNPQIKLRRIAEQQTRQWWVVEKVSLRKAPVGEWSFRLFVPGPCPGHRTCRCSFRKNIAIQTHSS